MGPRDNRWLWPSHSAYYYYHNYTYYNIHYYHGNNYASWLV